MPSIPLIQARENAKGKALCQHVHDSILNVIVAHQSVVAVAFAVFVVVVTAAIVMLVVVPMNHVTERVKGLKNGKHGHGEAGGPGTNTTTAPAAAPFLFRGTAATTTTTKKEKHCHYGPDIDPKRIRLQNQVSVTQRLAGLVREHPQFHGCKGGVLRGCFMVVTEWLLLLVLLLPVIRGMSPRVVGGRGHDDGKTSNINE